MSIYPNWQWSFLRDSYFAQDVKADGFNMYTNISIHLKTRPISALNV